MDCSRCGGSLDTYTLGDSEASVCVDCGFVDTPVDHQGSVRPAPEPWDEALRRFYEKHAELLDAESADEFVEEATDNGDETAEQEAVEDGDEETADDTTDEETADDGNEEAADDTTDEETVDDGNEEAADDEREEQENPA